MAILISGASGFLGQKLLSNIDSNEKIYALARDLNKTLPVDNKSIEWIEFDLSKDLIDISNLDKITTVIHLAGATLGAGDDEMMHLQSNELTTFNLLRSVSNHCCDFIYASSQVVYGNPDNLNIDENFKLNSSISPYACSKLNSENWLRWFQSKVSLRCISLRLCGFVDGGGLIDYLISSAAKNANIELYGNGKVVRDYITSLDAITAIINAMDVINSLEREFLPINIGSGQPLTSIKIAEIIIDCLESKSNIVILDKDAPFKNLMLNIDRAKNVLNFKPSNLPKSIKEYALNKNEDHNE